VTKESDSPALCKEKGRSTPRSKRKEGGSRGGEEFIGSERVGFGQYHVNKFMRRKKGHLDSRERRISFAKKEERGRSAVTQRGSLFPALKMI